MRCPLAELERPARSQVQTEARAPHASRRQAALLVFLSRTARAGIVAPDLGAAAHVGFHHVMLVIVAMMMVVVVVPVIVVVPASALVLVGVRMGRSGRHFGCLSHDLSSVFARSRRLPQLWPA